MNPFCKNNKQLSIFVTAGYPELNSLPSQIAFLESKGVDFIEVGIPFSDPMADGPTIQESSEIALRNGMTVTRMFEQLKDLKSNIPLVIMSYFNPILHFGLERFLEHCNQSNVAHVIVPDISMEVYQHLYQSQFEKHGVTVCFLVTPETSSERITQMSQHSKHGFIYLVSSSMTTGNSVKKISDSEIERIQDAVGDTPLMVGFGITSREDVLNVHQKADGAIIGSAYLRALSEGKQDLFISNVLGLELQNL